MVRIVQIDTNVHEIPSRDQLSEEMIESLWFSKQELKTIRKECKDTIRHLDETPDEVDLYCSQGPQEELGRKFLCCCQRPLCPVLT